MEKVNLTIDGMTCEHCIRAVHRALEMLPATEVVSVKIGSATVRIDPHRVDEEALVDAIADEGYTAFRSEG